MKYQYFSRIQIYDKIKGILEPDMILRTKTGKRPYHMETYTKDVPWWRFNLHETFEHAHGEDDHYSITEEEAMAIIERWEKELPLEEAIANLKNRQKSLLRRANL